LALVTQIQLYLGFTTLVEFLPLTCELQGLLLATQGWGLGEFDLMSYLQELGLFAEATHPGCELLAS
jgi:hypothetical protein